MSASFRLGRLAGRELEAPLLDAFVEQITRHPIDPLAVSRRLPPGARRHFAGAGSATCMMLSDADGTVDSEDEAETGFGRPWSGRYGVDVQA
jgi:hypothetical protein